MNNIDDIIHDSYLRCLRARRADEIRAPKAFLFRTARNLALDHLRSHQVSKRTPMVDSEFSNVVDLSVEVPEEVARGQELLILKQAIQSLPDRCREIFIMHKFQELPPREIAKILGLSAQTVSNQLQRGLSKCVEYVERYRKEWQGDDL